MRVLVAGGGGAIGRRLVPRLAERGHEVVATTRSESRFDALRALGAEPLAMDGLDERSVGEAVARAEPDAIVHQMTSLPPVLSPKRFDDAFSVTNELRTAGTDNLLAAAEALGVRRLVAQSFAGWPYARAGGPVKTEDDPLDADPPAAQVRSLRAIRHLEGAVLGARLDGVVLRYGSLYGPGASEGLVELVRRRKLPLVGDGAGVWSWLHVDDAAAATVAAVEGGPAGLYAVVDDEPAPVAEWLPHLAACVGAPPPRRVPVWLARLAVGDAGVSLMTQVRGSDNAKAKRQLGWRPLWPTWRAGFRDALHEPKAGAGRLAPAA